MFSELGLIHIDMIWGGVYVYVCVCVRARACVCLRLTGQPPLL